MSLFGGGSSSSSSTSNVVTNIDRRQVIDAGGAGISGDVSGSVTLNLTDNGAVAAASEVAQHALDDAASSFRDLLISAGDQARAQLQGFQSLVGAAAETADTSERARLQGFQSLLDTNKANLADVLGTARDSLGRLLDLGQGVLNVESQQSSQTSDIVKTAAQSANTSAATIDLVKYIVVAAALVAGVFVFRKAA